MDRREIDGVGLIYGSLVAFIWCQGEYRYKTFSKYFILCRDSSQNSSVARLTRPTSRADQAAAQVYLREMFTVLYHSEKKQSLPDLASYLESTST
jgi:hypothetical protein